MSSRRRRVTTPKRGRRRRHTNKGKIKKIYNRGRSRSPLRGPAAQRYQERKTQRFIDKTKQSAEDLKQQRAYDRYNKEVIREIKENERKERERMFNEINERNKENMEMQEIERIKREIKDIYDNRPSPKGLDKINRKHIEEVYEAYDREEPNSLSRNLYFLGQIEKASNIATHGYVFGEKKRKKRKKRKKTKGGKRYKKKRTKKKSRRRRY